MQVIYYESGLRDHPRVQSIIDRVGRDATLIECNHYGEVFNQKNQNFRLQKKRPALILAEKKGRLVIPTPEGFGIGGQENYYFSHMLNCLYDCRYCFLQGMYPSAHYLMFVNYEDFMAEISQTLTENVKENLYFFSGYDCDSLALNSVTHFLEDFIPFFRENPRAILELRTKSTSIDGLLSQSVIDNCVVAFSFTPAVISEKIEHKVPSLKKRLLALQKLAKAGWTIGLRLDPLIYDDHFSVIYPELIDQIFQHISSDSVHSVSIGPLRFPQKMYQKIVKLYPKEPLLAQPFCQRGRNYSYQLSLEKEMKAVVLNHLHRYVPSTLLFECYAS